MSDYRFLNVLKKERRGAEVIDGAVEESLDFFLMKVHGDQVIEPRPAHHFGNQLGDDASSLAHFTYIRSGDKLGGKNIVV